MKRITMLAVAVALVAGVGAAAPAATVTGLTGKVQRGPTGPVCRTIMSCYAPYKGALVFTRITAGTAPVTPVRTLTTAEGTYKVVLEPSRYRVTTGAPPSRVGNVVKPAVVTVPQAGTKQTLVSQTGLRHVNFVIDTGIR